MRRFLIPLRPVREAQKLEGTGFRFVAKFNKSGETLMNYFLKPVIAVAMFAFLATSNVQAGEHEKMVIALKTGDFELVETDISDLAIGESKTIETDEGKVIDVLRTADGAEIYVDGELLEMDSEGLHEQGLHEKHMVRKHVEVICDDDEECDHNVFVMAGDDADGEWVTDGGNHIVIDREIELTCSADENETECSEKMVWISDDGEELEGDFDLEELHEMHGEAGDNHKVIMIKKKVVKDD